MDFAKRQLEKYGWKEGKGLGKNENGRSTAIKPSLKFDNTGVGHEMGKDFTNKWWENVYDKAAKNIEICKNDTDIKLKRIAEEVEITTKDYSVRDFKKNNDTMEYGTFLKTAKLTQDGVVNYDSVVTPEEIKTEFKQISDDDLFAICGGRTAHKGARHGLNLSGKLSRIEKQEKLLLKKLEKVKLEDKDEKVCRKKLKKLKKLAEAEEQTGQKASTSSASVPDTTCKKKKKKRKRKSVSFSETVLEYSTHELDDTNEGCSSSNSESCTPKVEVHEKRINDNHDENDNEDPITTDEGIELDCEAKNDERGQEESFSFSEMQTHKKDKEKKKKKKTKVVAVIEPDEANMPEDGDGASTSGSHIVNKKKKRRRARHPGQEIDIDGVQKIKRKKHQQREICDISDCLEECHISE